MGLIKIIPQVLSSSSADLIMAGLECLHCILAHGKKAQEMDDEPINPYLFPVESEGIIVKLEELQNHPSNEIYKKVSKIIDTFFETENTGV